jgi:cytoskeleton protein RodZ
LTEAASSGVGAELARVREERGLALSDVAQQLKFGARQIEALEQERFEILPGGTFVRGMVRAYARLLKVDAEPLLGRLTDRFDAPDSNSLAARYKQPVPFADGARKSTFVYLGASLGVLVAVGAIAYQWYSEHNAPRQAPVAAAPKAATPKAAAPKAAAPKAETAKAETPAARPAPVAAQPVVEAKVAEKATEKVAVVAKEKTVPVAEKNDKAEKALKEAALIQKPIPSGVHRIVFHCEEEAWLEVRDAQGRQLLSSLNPPGCERVVQGRGPFELVIGNASHVRVLHNDRVLDLRPHSKQDIARFTIP